LEQSGVLAACAAARTATAAPPARGAAKHRGIAMTIGLNNVDPRRYPGAPPLRGCVNDAKDIRNLAKLNKFEVREPLIDSQATADAVIAGIKECLLKLDEGDIFLLQCSGHGGQVKDLNGDESDGRDETWCLYDRQMVDDELDQIWVETKYAPGIRVLMISDICHSGTVARGKGYLADLKEGGTQARGDDDRQRILAELADPQVRFRFMPDDVLDRNFELGKADYQRISDQTRAAVQSDERAIKAAVLLLSGCQDNQLSGDRSNNGLFTARLLNVWKDGDFKGNYRQFHAAIVSQMPPSQTPNFYPIGQPDLGFWLQRPFTT
jgi:metacaspase-1